MNINKEYKKKLDAVRNAEKNASEYIDQEQIMNNLALQEGQTEIEVI